MDALDACSVADAVGAIDDWGVVDTATLGSARVWAGVGRIVGLVAVVLFLLILCITRLV